MRAVIAAFFLLTCLASLNAQEQTGTIVFYRDLQFGKGHLKPAVFCDGSELARIENGTYFQVTAPAGLHTCTAESLQHPVIEVTVIAGQAAYVKVEIQPGFKEHALLANTAEGEYTKQVTRLKALKEWNRNTLRSTQPSESTGSGTPQLAQLPSPSSTEQSIDRSEGKHSGKFGDLALSVSEFVIFPAQANRTELEAYVSAVNTGKGVICANFEAILDTTFGLQYQGDSGQAPRIDEMLPGESTMGSYTFNIKNGDYPI